MSHWFSIELARSVHNSSNRLWLLLRMPAEQFMKNMHLHNQCVTFNLFYFGILCIDLLSPVRHWHNNCFMNRHDWATNCWKIGACSNVECDSSMCNWQVFLMSHHTIVLRANQASSSNPSKQVEWQTLKASLTFCFVAWWPWIFGTALPPPPQEKNSNKNKNSHLWAFTLHLSICLPSCWKHLKASRVSFLALSNYYT